MDWGGIVCCGLFGGIVGDFPAVKSEVPGRVGVGLRPELMAEENSNGEDDENDDDRAHGIRVVVRGPVSYG